MKHQVCILSFCISFLLYADNDNHLIVDKSKRIGRFSYEDSFDENLAEDVLKHAPAIVKKNIKKLLYPSSDDEIPQRLLLLGESNLITIAIAKTIALRCGYEYYVIDAAALLREYREGRQMLLTEVRPIVKSGKPIALIIPELPEMADYSGLLASTLWLLVDQCTQYQDVLVITTSVCKKKKLSEDVKERFGENIISILFDDKFMEEQIKKIIKPNKSWIEQHKTECFIAAGFICSLLTMHLLYAMALFNTQDALLLVQKEQRDIQKKQYIMQMRQYHMQLNQYIVALYQLIIESQQARYERNQDTQYDKYIKYLQQFPAEQQKTISAKDDYNEKMIERVVEMAEDVQKNISITIHSL